MCCLILVVPFSFFFGMVGPASPVPRPRQSIEVQTLFRQLESRETTDSAAEKLLKLCKADPKARQYLVEQLPAMIQRGPAESQMWNNAAQLAGSLKIAEAVPALIKWIGKAARGSITLSETARLNNSPAAKSLLEIGDPSVPWLARVLQHGNLAERWDAALVLQNIGTSNARDTLRKHLERETDTSLQSFIKRSLA